MNLVMQFGTYGLACYHIEKLSYNIKSLSNTTVPPLLFNSLNHFKYLYEYFSQIGSQPSGVNIWPSNPRSS